MGSQDNKPPYEHQIICTGKETHRRVQFRPIFSKGYDAAEPDEWLRDVEVPARFELYGQWRESFGASELKPSYRFKCKYCGRDTQLTAAKLVETLDAFNDAGRYPVDISRLPF